MDLHVLKTCKIYTKNVLICINISFKGLTNYAYKRKYELTYVSSYMQSISTYLFIIPKCFILFIRHNYLKMSKKQQNILFNMNYLCDSNTKLAP